MSSSLNLWEDHAVTGKPRGAKKALVQALKVADVKNITEMVLVGAGALATYGAPRYSEDVDLLMSSKDAKKLVRGLLDSGFSGPPPSSDVFIYFMESPSGFDVDVMGAEEPLYLDAIDSAQEGIFLGQSVLVPSPEFFVLMKLRAAEGDPDRRLRHLGDIQDLLRVRKVDMDFVRTYVKHNESDLMPQLKFLLRK